MLWMKDLLTILAAGFVLASVLTLLVACSR